MNRSLDLGMISTTGFQSPPDKAPNCRNPPNAVPNRELISGLTGARVSVWRLGDGGETAEEGELGDSGTRASGEGEE
jgi:hypothetical protein